jgi:hypothetical protein
VAANQSRPYQTVSLSAEAIYFMELCHRNALWQDGRACCTGQGSIEYISEFVVEKRQNTHPLAAALTSQDSEQHA